MNNWTKPRTYTVFLIHGLLICICMICCMNEKKISADTEKVEWGYETENGPDVWGKLSKDYILCAEGRHQSPIDLVNPTRVKLSPIIYEYPLTTGIDIRNTGHTIEVACPEGSWIQVDDTRHPLLQFHFHAPSEHTVAGKQFDMEMHLVHKSEEGSLAVVGLLIEQGSPNAAFDSVWSHLPTVPGEARRVEESTLDLNRMLSPNGQITDASPHSLPNTYRYDGSLTTPPCSEDVKWFVLTTPVEMSAAQIDAFKAIIHDNNRPVQPLNGRELLTDVEAKE